jgi:membrane protease YdiL (CAAX protease family)
MGTVIAWVVIIASASVLIVRPRWVSRIHDSAAQRAEAPSIARTPSTQLEMMGRLAMGMHGLVADPKLTPKLMQQIDATVRTPLDEFRAIILAGEIAGNDAALDRLELFEREHEVVRLRGDADALWVIYTKGADHLSAQQVKTLEKDHRWFGTVAVSHGLPPTDPRRQAATGPVGRAMLFMGAAALLGLGLLVTGFVLLIVAMVMVAKGRVRLAYQPARIEVSGRLVEGFAVYLGGMVVVSLLLTWLVANGALWMSFILLGLLPVVMIYLHLRGLGWDEMRQALGWVRGRGLWREVGAGVMGYITGLPILLIGSIITMVLMKVTGNSAAHPIVNQPVDRPGDVLQIALLACVMAPILEETMFRGALFGHLRARLGWWISAPIVSVIFAAIHPQGWVAIPVLGGIAMMLAGLREWRGSLIASMTAHAINNGVAVLMLVALAG